MIEVKNLVRTFKSGDRTIKPVNDVSFELEQGTLASIVGKSGSGKSTLLSLLGALDKPTSGDVVVNGVSLAGMPDGEADRLPAPGHRLRVPAVQPDPEPLRRWTT